MVVDGGGWWWMVVMVVVVDPAVLSPSWGTQYVATSDIDQTCRALIGWEVRPVTILLVHLQQPILNRYCV